MLYIYHVICQKLNIQIREKTTHQKCVVFLHFYNSNMQHLLSLSNMPHLYNCGSVSYHNALYSLSESA